MADDKYEAGTANISSVVMMADDSYEAATSKASSEAKMVDDNCEAGTATASSEAKMADDNCEAGIATASSEVKMAEDNCEAGTSKASSEAKMADNNCELCAAANCCEAMMVDESFEADMAKVFELFDNIVLLNNIQRIRDIHTTPDCSAERLLQLIEVKKEKDRQVARYYRELVMLLLKRHKSGRNPNETWLVANDKMIHICH